MSDHDKSRWDDDGGAPFTGPGQRDVPNFTEEAELALRAAIIDLEQRNQALIALFAGALLLIGLLLLKNHLAKDPA
jgi:hypothetical protein